jgi:hypothetical protein
VANFIMGISDVSRQRRFHNYRFARTALALGLKIEAHPSIGHITPALQTRTAERYAAELRSLEKALTLVWSPNPDRYLTSSTSVSKPTALTGKVQSIRKYITASCRCTRSDGSRRTIRVAAGWWILGPIRCGVCNIDFTASTGVSDNRVSKRELTPEPRLPRGAREAMSPPSEQVPADEVDSRSKTNHHEQRANPKSDQKGGRYECGV